MRWLAIINPTADHHTAAQCRQLDEALQRRVGACCLWTAHRNHAVHLVRAHPEYDVYVAAGGDGTISEVVNALDVDAQSLAIIPSGTGNGLARDLHLQSEPAALHALDRPHFSAVDVISVRFHRQHDGWRERKMISTSALGYVADTTDVFYHHCKFAGMEAVAAFLQCFRQKELTLRMRLDNRVWQDLAVTNLVIHNTQHLGSFRLFPEARVQDGWLNLLYGSLSTVQQLFEDLAIVTRTFFFQRSLRARARSVEIRLPEPSLLMVDGDLYRGVDAITYDIEPARLSCCMP